VHRFFCLISQNNINFNINVAQTGQIFQQIFGRTAMGVGRRRGTANIVDRGLKVLFFGILLFSAFFPFHQSINVHQCTSRQFEIIVNKEETFLTMAYSFYMILIIHFAIKARSFPGNPARSTDCLQQGLYLAQSPASFKESSIFDISFTMSKKKICRKWDFL